MIKFFRKIRQNLVNEGNIQKYLLYSIGEIILVVIGILIALQVNNWNQQQSLKSVEESYLKNLKIEFASNLAELNVIHKNRRNHMKDQLRLMDLAGTNPKACPDTTLSKLLLSIYDYGRIVFAATTPIFEELKNTGKLVTISNPALRKKLTLWEQKFKHIDESQKDYKGYRHALLSIIAKDGTLKDIGNTDPSVDKVVGLNFRNTNKKLLSNPEVGNLLYLLWGELEWFDKSIYPETKKHLEEILQLIEQELK